MSIAPTESEKRVCVYVQNWTNYVIQLDRVGGSDPHMPAHGHEGWNDYFHCSYDGQLGYPTIRLKSPTGCPDFRAEEGDRYIVFTGPRGETRMAYVGKDGYVNRTSKEEIGRISGDLEAESNASAMDYQEKQAVQ